MRIDEKIEEKKAEVRAAAQACADAAYLASTEWRELGDRYLDGEPAETLPHRGPDDAEAAYRTAVKELYQLRQELLALATERRKVLNR